MRQFSLPTYSDGTLPTYADGGYPLIYMTADGSILCPKCANAEGHMGCGAQTSRGCEDGDPQWCLVAGDVHWEGPAETCEHCNEPIPSAYGDPESEV